MASRVLYFFFALSSILRSSDAARSARQTGGESIKLEVDIRTGNEVHEVLQNPNPLFTSERKFPDKGPMFTSEKKFPDKGPLFPAQAPTSPAPAPQVQKNSSAGMVDAKGNTVHSNGHLNMGKKCQSHNCPGGPCPYCGTGFCCRKGLYFGGCSGTDGGEKAHVCVIAPTYEGPSNLGEECWNTAKCKGGLCGYCGSGLCCRMGRAEGGCGGKVGGNKRHECVASGVPPVAGPEALAEPATDLHQPSAPEYIADPEVEAVEAQSSPVTTAPQSGALSGAVPDALLVLLLLLSVQSRY